MFECLEHEKLFELEEIYKAFGSIPRLKILIHMKNCDLNNCECTVNKLSEISGLSQSATSHQLKDLKSKKIIKSKKVGLNVFYSLHDSHIFKIIESGIHHVKGDHCNE